MKLKKVLAVCLATAMTFSMVACGGAGTDTTPADTSADTETEAPAEEETEAPAEEEAEAPAEDGALTYSSIKLGEDYTDITTTITAEQTVKKTVPLQSLWKNSIRYIRISQWKQKALRIMQKMHFFVLPQVTGAILCSSLQ